MVLVATVCGYSLLISSKHYSLANIVPENRPWF